MKVFKHTIKLAVIIIALLMVSACQKLLDEPAENKSFTEQTDYTQSANMIQPLIGAYADFYDRGWEEFPPIAVRGDDVNAGGLGDQQDFSEEDKFNYNKDYWMFNSLWQQIYKDMFTDLSAMDQVQLYADAGASQTKADQYIAEAKVLQAWDLFQLSRVWGAVLIPTSSDPSDILTAELTPKDQVMQYISDLMDEAIPNLLDMRPNERTDIRGGITKYTALAIKALANLEMKNYQAVADATGAIISSAKFSLEPDFYQLFKLKGKLNNENLLEYQYSDFGQGAGNQKAYLFAFFGPQNWSPYVKGAGSGWGFYEPSLKWIKFMLDRGEHVRLQTSVLFTNRGINEIEKDPNYSTLPSWISNVTQDGDTINDYSRALFASGKHYLPSDMLTPGRTDYGNNKNFQCIRYAEVLLMYAEALTQGASGSAGSADDAVNLVRERAGLPDLSGVTNAQVMDEKFAELAMEWGTRYYDMVRLGNYSALSYEGRTFTEDKIYLPYPQNQVDQLPALGGN